MTLDPKTFLESNYDFVVKRCQDNWIENPDKIMASLINIVTQLELLRWDDDKTCDLIKEDLAKLVKEDLAKLYPTAERVYIDLLFRSVEGNPFYVYATNYFIRRMNSSDGTNISLREKKFLKQFQELLMIKNISVFEDFIVSSFPKPEERFRFLLLLSNEFSQKKALPGGVKISVSMVMLEKRIQALLKSTNKMVDEYFNDRSNSNNKPTAGQKALIIYCRYRNSPIKKTLMDTIQEAHEREGWETGSYKHIKNLYDAIGKETKNNPATSKNLIAISGLLSEEERQEALSVQRK